MSSTAASSTRTSGSPGRRALSAATVATFVGVSAAMYANAPGLRPLWVPFGARSGREFMLTSGLARVNERSMTPARDQANVAAVNGAAAGDTAFVLGGGGMLGAAEVGMLRALLEAGIEPDLVLGTSVGAINGALIASEPTLDRVERLEGVWQEITADDSFGGSLFGRLATLARSRTHIHSSQPLRRLLAAQLPSTFEQLAVPFQCVAASIERAGARWFRSGPLIDAVLASAAVPGLLPPVEIDGEHHLDGGLVHSIPVGRAVELGARTIYVLQVGRIETPLHTPTWPWEVALVAFEIGRRHRFVEDMSRLPDGVAVHVLPTGQDEPLRYTDPAQLRYRDTSQVAGRIERAYRATADYLDGGKG